MPCGSGLDPNPRADGRRTVKASARPPRRKPDETAGFVRGVYDQFDSNQEAIARIIATDTDGGRVRRRDEGKRDAGRRKGGTRWTGGGRAAAEQRTPRLSTSPPERSGRALVVVAELQREKRRTSAISSSRFSGINQTVRERRPSTTRIGRSRGPSGVARCVASPPDPDARADRSAMLSTVNRPWAVITPRAVRSSRGRPSCSEGGPQSLKTVFTPWGRARRGARPRGCRAPRRSCARRRTRRRGGDRRRRTRWPVGTLPRSR